MKTANEAKDPVLDKFFSAYKRHDRHLPVPDYPEPRKKIKKRTLAFLGIAASLIIGLFYLEKGKEEISLDRDVLIISLEKNGNQDPTIIVTTTTSMDMWKSPTSSLLTEF